MSWFLGQDDADTDQVTDEVRRDAFTTAVMAIAVVAIYAYVAVNLGRTLDVEHDAQMQRQAPLVERWQQMLGDFQALADGTTPPAKGQ